MNAPDDPQLDELLGAYALDALDGEEQSRVESYVATSQRARDEVEQHRAVAALLAHSGDLAPRGIWDNIVDQLEGEVMPEVDSFAGLERIRAWLHEAAEGRPGPDIELVGRGVDGEVCERLVVERRGAWAARLDGSALIPLEAGRVYQLWGEVDGSMVSVAVLGREPAVWSFPLSQGVDALHLTVEESPHGVAITSNRPLFSSSRS